MTQFASRFGLLTGIALAGAMLVAGCAAPVARTVTETTTTTAVVPPPPPVATPPVMSTTTTTEAVEPTPVNHNYVRRTRHANGDVVREEATTETGSTTIVPAVPPVRSTTTRTTSETITPR